MTEAVDLEVLKEVEGRDQEAGKEVVIGTKIAKENEIEEEIERKTERETRSGKEEGTKIEAKKEDVVIHQAVAHQAEVQAAALTEETRNVSLEVEVLNARNVATVEKEEEGPKVKVYQSPDQGVEKEKTKVLKAGK